MPRIPTNLLKSFIGVPPVVAGLAPAPVPVPAPVPASNRGFSGLRAGLQAGFGGGGLFAPAAPSPAAPSASSGSSAPAGSSTGSAPTAGLK